MSTRGRSSRHPRHAQARRRRSRRAGTIALLALAGLVLLGAGAAGAMVLAPQSRDSAGDAAGGSATASAPGAASLPSTPAASTVASDQGLPMRPTMLAQVVRVDAGDEVVVDVAGRTMPVHILGVDAPDAAAPGRPAQCGSAEALAFANDRLTGQMVTLVPDPTLPELDEQGRRLAYVVLRSQLSYTDAALVTGTVRADTSRPLWYADVFAREQAQAARDERGIWGPPCREKLGS